MQKKSHNVLAIVLYSIGFVFAAYLTFVAAQGFCSCVSRVFDSILEALANLLPVIMLTAVMVYIYRLIWKRPSNLHHFCQKNSIFLIIVSGLSFIFMLIRTINYTNWKVGPSPLYPVAYVVISFIILLLAIFNLVYCRTFELIPYEKGEHFVLRGFEIAAIYILAFVTLDRFGAVMVTMFSGPYKAVVIGALFPTILFSLSFTIGAACFCVYLAIKNEKAKGILELVASLVCLSITIFATVFNISMAFGESASEFIKLLSPFFSLDRLAALPITLVLLVLCVLVPSIIFLVHWIRKFVNNKKTDHATQA